MNSKSVCVFCGSRVGRGDTYAQLAREIGTKLAQNDTGLVYGGGSVGLMGIVARSAAEAGGDVIGIIPKFLEELEIAQEGLTRLEVVDTMHERKERMFTLSDAFVVMPGGLGSLDETFEIATWAQLRLHSKPIFLLNHEGYWDPLMDLVDHIISHGFADPSSRRFFQLVPDFDAVIEALNNHKNEAVQKFS
ncbi:MAG: TIGR00730 family Rossman fold protein [Sphingomonadales bacterium]